MRDHEMIQFIMGSTTQDDLSRSLCITPGELVKMLEWAAEVESKYPDMLKVISSHVPRNASMDFMMGMDEAINMLCLLVENNSGQTYEECEKEHRLFYGFMAGIKAVTSRKAAALLGENV